MLIQIYQFLTIRHIFFIIPPIYMYIYYLFFQAIWVEVAYIMALAP